MKMSLAPKSVLATAVAVLAFTAASQAAAAPLAEKRTTPANASVAGLQPAAATVLYANTFDSNTSGSNLTAAGGGSWAKDGAGTAVITTIAGLPEAGAGAALFAPGSTTAGTWVYRSNTVIADPVGSGAPIVTASAGLRIASPASGTANRSVVLGLQTYDTNIEMLGSALLVWDGGGTFGFGANHLVLQFGWGDGSSDFGYDFGAVTSAQLSAVGYFDVSISLNYETGDITFGWANSVLGHTFATESTLGSFDPGVSPNFSDADFYYGRGSTGGTLPRLLGDNYSITTDAVPVPEPESWALMLGGLGALGMLARRRKPQ